MSSLNPGEMSSNRGGRLRRQRSQSYGQYASSLANVPESLNVLFPSISVSGTDLQCNGGIEKLDHQVAGHQFFDGKNTIGMLKSNDGSVLKPVMKPETGNREINFYQQLQTSTDPMLLELKDYVSAFYGTRMLSVEGKQTEFLILENLTEGMSEPCVLDIKIGKQTWDSTASLEKIETEKLKYAQCKKDVSFCIPGFQVYKLSTDRLHRYNKEYGKKLNGESVTTALKIFLNGEVDRGVNRELLMQLLTILWKIQKWARKQKSISLYSTSLLIIYDCRKLRYLNICENSSKAGEPLPILQRKISFDKPEDFSGTANFSGQISFTGPVFKPTLPFLKHSLSSQTANKNQTYWHETVRKIGRSQSFNLNYNDYLTKVKNDYQSTLKELNLSESQQNKPWCKIKIIDFAHTFPNEDDTFDTNYIEGIDSVVKIFEKFLEER